MVPSSRGVRSYGECWPLRLYTLMGWLEDGSVVTWGEVLKKLMVVTGSDGRCVP